jgi:hypothetical protein
MSGLELTQWAPIIIAKKVFPQFPALQEIQFGWRQPSLIHCQKLIVCVYRNIDFTVEVWARLNWNIRDAKLMEKINVKVEMRVDKRGERTYIMEQ